MTLDSLADGISRAREHLSQLHPSAIYGIVY